MKASQRSIASGLLTVALMAATAGTAFGWGEVGHKMVVRIAADLMPPGERAPMLSASNYELLEYYVLAPDMMGEMDKKTYRETEGYHHFLNMELLDPGLTSFDAFRLAIGGQTKETGNLIARTHECSALLTDAVKRGSREDWLHWAGYLAHYVGDAHQPLHTTSNHDGRETGNLKEMKDPDGLTVHIRYESGLLNHYGTEIENTARDLAARYLGSNGGLEGETRRFEENSLSYICAFGWGAHGHVAEILDADNGITAKNKRFSVKRGRYWEKMYGKLGDLTAAQIARAAIAVAAMWHHSAAGDRGFESSSAAK